MIDVQPHPVGNLCAASKTGEKSGIATRRDMNMSAYIVIEGVVRDKEALARYGQQATPLIKQWDRPLGMQAARVIDTHGHR